MPARDNRHGTMPGGFGFDLDIEFFPDSLFQGDADTLFVDIAAALRHGVGRHVTQHLQLVLRASDQRPERHGNRQADHPRTRNAHAHGVLEDIGAQAHGDFFGPHTEQLGGSRRAQGDGNRLGTPDGGHHFAVDKGYDSVSFVL